MNPWVFLLAIGLLLAGCSAESRPCPASPVPARGGDASAEEPADAGPEINEPDSIPATYVPNACPESLGGQYQPMENGPCCGSDGYGPMEPGELCVFGDRIGGLTYLSSRNIRFTVGGSEPRYRWLWDTSRCRAEEVEEGRILVESTLCFKGATPPPTVVGAPLMASASCQPLGLKPGHYVAVCLEFDVPSWTGPAGKCVQRTPRRPVQE